MHALEPEVCHEMTHRPRTAVIVAQHAGRVGCVGHAHDIGQGPREAAALSAVSNQRGRWQSFLQPAALLLMATLVGCSAEQPQSEVRAAQGDNASDVLVTDTSKTGVTGSVGDGVTGAVISTDRGGAGSASSEPTPRLSEADSCVSSNVEAERVPVDMYIMLDRSGSMLNETGAGPTKWDATREALDNFLKDPRSEGLSVGLQYFPLAKPGASETCRQDADCGDPDNGPCVNRLCRPSRFGPSIPVTFCLSDVDCPLLSDGCFPAGSCASDQTLACFALGDDGCGAGDACEPLLGQCYGFASCEAARYAQPDVAIAALPDNAVALSGSLANAMPIGLTPTYAALGGALEQTRAHAQANPTHRVVAVLATDGTPAGCELDDPASVEGLVAEGVGGDPSISTYVVGVFGPEETEARANLDAWARAGATERAFIVDPQQDVSAQFLEALESIRGGALACEYQIPPSPTNTALDFKSVNVALTSDQLTYDFRYVGDASRCDLAELGWYYDVEPETGENPTKISVCADACKFLQSKNDATVEVRLGCLTRGPD